MIDVTNESTLSLAQACDVLPRGRRRAKLHFSTLLRWVLRGAPALDGRRVRLEAVRLGARWVTSREAIARFVGALTPDLDGASQQPPPRTPGQRQRASRRAARTLEKIGI